MPNEPIKFPTRDQIEARTDQIINGIGYPYLSALPGIVFRRLTLRERGQVNASFTRFIKESMDAGGMFSEPLLPTELRRRCHEVGIDYDELMAQEEEFQKRIFDQAPPDLRDAGHRVTEEEMAAMQADTRAAYLESVRERGRQVKAYIDGLFTPAEKATRAQIAQVRQLEADLQAQTYEHHARVHRCLVEILHGARRADDQSKPYFGSLEELYELQDTDSSTWLALCAKWREFREGRWPGFTRRSSSTASTGGA